MLSLRLPPDIGCYASCIGVLKHLEDDAALLQWQSSHIPQILSGKLSDKPSGKPTVSYFLAFAKRKQQLILEFSFIYTEHAKVS